MVNSFLRKNISVIILCILFTPKTNAQDFLKYQKNFISFNSTQAGINELNVGFEHLFSQRRSIELNGGFIYQNHFMLKNTSNWDNSLYFYERGFAVRTVFKFYKKPKENSRWKEYFAPVLTYEYLYIPNGWFAGSIDTAAKPSGVNEKVDGYMHFHRFRSRIGAEFLLGWITNLNKTFNIELYAGIGARYIIASRTDIAQSLTQFDETPQYINEETSQSYFRPSVHAGVKIRVGW